MKSDEEESAYLPPLSDILVMLNSSLSVGEKEEVEMARRSPTWNKAEFAPNIIWSYFFEFIIRGRGHSECK